MTMLPAMRAWFGHERRDYDQALSRWGHHLSASIDAGEVVVSRPESYVQAWVTGYRRNVRRYVTARPASAAAPVGMEASQKP